MKHVTILGGGPAGLAVAYYAHKKGIPYRLFEKSDHLGGLCRTLRSGQHRYDTGAHRLHDRDPEVTRDLKALLGNRLQAVDSPSKIYFEGRFIDFPPTPLNMLFSSGFRDLGRIALDIVRARSRRHEIRSFEDFAVGNFGRTLAERFLLGYSEKVWGLPCDRLSPDIATRRLSGMSPGSLILELFLV